MNLRFHIDRLVLEGVDFPPGQGRALQAAIEGELRRLLAARDPGGPWPAGAAAAALQAPSICLDGNPAPRELGRRIAGSIAGALAGQEPNLTRRRS